MRRKKIEVETLQQIEAQAGNIAERAGALGYDGQQDKISALAHGGPMMAAFVAVKCYQRRLADGSRLAANRRGRD